ncbi:mitochondrial carrier homolog 2-like [Teleopsis dalmanni]|uniref:mitochondrial carrier homolog 2-like n=1 Tax=Teleopsis dalmanni TaxID=139649 RepID=UPI000D32A085|nr:mitochondrial carrier homolog 2-like [Teleopsis dalmanni]
MIASTYVKRDENAAVPGFRSGTRVLLSTILYPLEYAQILIQLGYEPQPARPHTTTNGRTIMIFPNIFEYALYIYRYDGFSGCFRGVKPRILGMIIGVTFSDRLANFFTPLEKQFSSNEERRIENFKHNFRRDLVVCLSSVIVSHPFQVIQVRMMAQFIGRETIYDSLITSIIEIYKNEGIYGFFQGLIPRMLNEIGSLLLTSACAYFINKHIVSKSFGRSYLSGAVQFCVTHLLYPLQVVTTCMMVNGTKLLVANPPNSVVYKTWLHCLTEMDKMKQLSRGRTFFWRIKSTVPHVPIDSSYLNINHRYY